jgi:hypothetical protein
MEEMKYEDFLRKAFGISEGMITERGGDPARLADVAIFNLGNLVKMKIGVGYSMEIFNFWVINAHTDMDSEKAEMIKSFPRRVLESSNSSQILALIEEYQNAVVDEYFTIQSGHISLK